MTHNKLIDEQIELDDETLGEMIEFRRETLKYHIKQENKVQATLHKLVLMALIELQERRKAGGKYHNMAEMEQCAEQAECVTLCLNELGVPGVYNEGQLSLWGRVRLYAEENSRDRAELQERRKADSAVFMYGISDPRGKPHLEEFCVSRNAEPLQCVVDELNEMQCEGEGDFYIVPLYISPRPLNDAELQERRKADSTKLVTQWPHRTVQLTFSHPTVGDNRFSPMMLAAHYELLEHMNKHGDPDKDFIASNGVTINPVNLTDYNYPEENNNG